MSAIFINEHIHLSPVEHTDADKLVLYCNDAEIYNNTLSIPEFYELKDAENFFNICEQKRNEWGTDVIWAIRNEKKELIGTFGLLRVYGKGAHKDEIGYMLGKPFRGKGIMTAVLKRFCPYLFDQFHLVRIEAHVFTHNAASAKTLINAGFEYEGLRKKYHFKNGNYVDCKLFALVR